MPVERRFSTPGLELAAIEWGDKTGIPVIALHGWLDNAGSFDLLAPLMSNCHIVALDSAGHGLSDHRSPDASYNIWQEVPDVFAVADLLGWNEFSVLSHSRGAAVATLCAGTYPSRVARVVHIDGGIPITSDAADAPTLLAKSIHAHKTLRIKPARIFAEREQAILKRSRGFTRITTGAAEILAKRSLRPVDGGYSWYFDQRLKAESEFRLTPDQVTAFLRAVSSPVLSLLASDSPFSNRIEYRRQLELFENLKIVEVKGGHHCHLEGRQNDIARIASSFFAERQ